MIAVASRLCYAWQGAVVMRNRFSLRRGEADGCQQKGFHAFSGCVRRAFGCGMPLPLASALRTAALSFRGARCSTVLPRRMSRGMSWRRRRFPIRLPLLPIRERLSRGTCSQGGCSAKFQSRLTGGNFARIEIAEGCMPYSAARNEVRKRVTISMESAVAHSVAPWESPCLCPMLTVGTPQETKHRASVAKGIRSKGTGSLISASIAFFSRWTNGSFPSLRHGGE